MIKKLNQPLPPTAHASIVELFPQTVGTVIAKKYTDSARIGNTKQNNKQQWILFLEH
jgi:hypothetical protein